MKNAFDNVRFLGFDVFGTVVDWRSGVARAAEPFLRRHHIALDALSFADEWRALFQPSLERVRSGARPWVKLSQLHRENLEAVLAKLGVERGAMPEAELDDLNRAWERLDPWPDAVEGMTRLKGRFTLGSLSNGDIAMMSNLARFGGLPWDIIVGAETGQNYKPQPQVYLKSAEAAAVAASQAAMVAAHNDDLQGAAGVGFRTLFVRRPHEYGPDQTSDLRAEGNWDVVVDTLTEAADALGCG